MRTWVIWGATIPMGVVLGSISICSSVAISVLMVLFAQSFQYAASPTPIIRGCFVSGVNNLIATIWAIILGNELFLLFATMSRGLRHITQGKPGTLNTLYWDALKFTGLLSLISIVSLVTAIAAPPSYQTAPSPLQRVLHSILASHVMLRLRRVSQMPAPEGSGTEGTLFHVDSTAVYQSRTGIAER
ncbi:hypothetical protein CALVIDRAFT_535788 [Calocera viscosa TUFC12733]|uniref:Uncharacterized protein n=1 Tax=Calocera viscosa (strain TUFC12733) TaxID=1330018 RepID=A0A167NGT3_CALVF|nr:hypothetical protein CALVIDRAFT_535788 [Calocera viscosa TUFC12733]